MKTTNKNLPAADLRLPQPPVHFSARTKALWNTIHAERRLSPRQTDALRLALEHLDLGDEARETLRRDGPVTATGKKHPAVDACKLFDGLYLRAMKAADVGSARLRETDDDQE